MPLDEDQLNAIRERAARNLRRVPLLRAATLLGVTGLALALESIAGSWYPLLTIAPLPWVLGHDRRLSALSHLFDSRSDGNGFMDGITKEHTRSFVFYAVVSLVPVAMVLAG